MKVYEPNIKGGVAGYREYIYITDTEASGTDSGTFTLGAWRTRILNTINEDETKQVTLSSNQFTLPAGKYEIFATAPAFRVHPHQARMQNITDAVTTLLGTSEHTSNTDNPNTRSIIFGIFEITSSKTFEIQHQCTTTGATNGFGVAASFTDEIYTTVQLWRIKE